MKYNIRGDKLEVTKPIEESIIEKLTKLEKYFESPETLTAQVLIRISGNKQVIEVTIPYKNIVLRAEERGDDLYVAINRVQEKLERQLEKNKTRMNKKHNMIKYNEFLKIDSIQTVDDEKSIIRRKEIESKPMSEEEAILQMNLVDHSFFLFINSENKRPTVAYRRNDGNYGLIELI